MTTITDAANQVFDIDVAALGVDGTSSLPAALASNRVTLAMKGDAPDSRRCAARGQAVAARELSNDVVVVGANQVDPIPSRNLAAAMTVVK